MFFRNANGSLMCHCMCTLIYLRTLISNKFAVITNLEMVKLMHLMLHFKRCLHMDFHRMPNTANSPLTCYLSRSNHLTGTRRGSFGSYLYRHRG